MTLHAGLLRGHRLDRPPASGLDTEGLRVAWRHAGDLGVPAPRPAARPREEQKERWLPDMLGGEMLGAYCLSEAHGVLPGCDAGSSPTTTAV